MLAQPTHGLNFAPKYVILRTLAACDHSLTLVHSYLMTPIYMIGYIWVMVIGRGATY